MLHLIDGLPSYVAAVRATGEVSKDDYNTVLSPLLEQVLKQHGHIHFLMVLDTPAGEFTAGAWLNDLKLGLKHFTNWRKIAIVTNQEAIEKITDVFNFLVPGKSKGFSMDELSEAKTWVSEE